MKNARARGFSLVEVLIVVAIIMILSVIAIPSIRNVNQVYKMDASGHITASLLAQARLQAVHNNAPAYTNYDAANRGRAFINTDNSGAFAVGNPDAALSGGVLFQAAGVPDHAQLDNYLGITGAAGDPKVQINTSIGFNSRGLPCMQNGTPLVCSQDDGTGALPVFEWFMTDANGNWEAVTVTAAGRIKAWRNTGSGSWQ